MLIHLATAVIASGRGLTSNTSSWLVFTRRGDSVGVSPLSLPRAAFLLLVTRHWSLCMRRVSSRASLFLHFLSPAPPLPPPPPPGRSRCLSLSLVDGVCRVITFSFSVSGMFLVAPPNGAPLARASMSERYPHPVGPPRPRLPLSPLPPPPPLASRSRTLPWRPKINSSCSLHFLPDVKQPFVRSCQARKTVRGVSRFLSLYEWHIDWRFMRSTPDNKYPRARMV